MNGTNGLSPSKEKLGMNKSLLVSGAVALALVGGCSSRKADVKEKPEVDQVQADKWFVTSATDTAVKNGIIAQHTLYPYHFVNDSAQLNELGMKELGILADHYKANAGQLNVRQGNSSDELYKARLQTVNSELRHAGVVPEHVVVADNFAGGPGMRSERVSKALKDEEKALGSGSSEGSTSSSSTGAANQGTTSQP